MTTTSPTIETEDPGVMKALAAFKQRIAERISERFDTWVNPWTGMGTARDRTTATTFEPSCGLTPQECSAMYHHDGLAARIVDLVPREMLREGFSLQAPEVDEAEVKAVEKELADLAVVAQGLEGLIWGRCMGGAIVLIGADDGRKLDEPLDVRGVRGIRFLKVYDRRRVQIEKTYKNSRSKSNGQPELYRIDPIDGESSVIVHESRCWRFRGAMTAEEERRALSGWEYSVLQRGYDAVRRFHGAHASAESLISDASQGVWRISGLIDAITGGQWARIQSRLMATEMGRSVFRAVVIDADKNEDFTKIPNSFSGVSDMLDRFANYLAAIYEIPVTVLMGQAPAGLAATGDADVRMLYDRIASERNVTLTPFLLRLVEILRRGETGWEVVYPPLWQESPSEKADRELKESQRDTAYMTAGVVTPEEVALSPHLDDVYPQIDREMRRLLLAEEQATIAFGGGETSTGNAMSLEIAPTDVALTVTVNEVRASKGLKPLPNGDVTLAQFKAQQESGVAPGSAAEQNGTTLATSAAPPGDNVPTEDDEAAPQDEEAARFARELNEYVNPKTGEKGARRCEHLALNRCTKCGIERVRRVVGSDDEGNPVYGVEWRPIGSKVAPSGGES